MPCPKKSITTTGMKTTTNFPKQMIEEVLLDREILDQLDQYEVDWDVAELDENLYVPREELSQEVLDLLS